MRSNACLRYSSQLAKVQAENASLVKRNAALDRRLNERDQKLKQMEASTKYAACPANDELSSCLHLSCSAGCNHLDFLTEP